MENRKKKFSTPTLEIYKFIPLEDVSNNVLGMSDGYEVIDPDMGGTGTEDEY